MYTYIIYGETITLIDTGVAGCEVPIFDAIRSAARDPTEIALTILTHSHPDHLGAARALQQVTRCRIAAHPAERSWIENVDLQNRERPVPGFATLVSGSVHLDLTLVEGDSVALGRADARELRVFHTPGHSPGSISLFLPSEGALFSGDAVPLAGEPPVYDDPFVSMASVQRLREVEGIQVLLSAWDKPRWGEEAYRQMDRAIEYLQSIHEVVRTFAGTGDTDPMELAYRVAAGIGLTPQAVTPLLARTVAAHLRYRERKNLLEDS